MEFNVGLKSKLGELDELAIKDSAELIGIITNLREENATLKRSLNSKEHELITIKAQIEIIYDIADRIR